MVMPTPDSPAGASDSNLGGAFADFIQDAAGSESGATGALNADNNSNASADDVINELLGLEGDKPGNVPYERYREVNERAKQAETTSSQLGEWQGVIDELRAQGLAEPTREAHARELSKLKPEARSEVWTAALAEAGGPENVTAEQIAAKGARHRKKKPRRVKPKMFKAKGKGWTLQLERSSVDVSIVDALRAALAQAEAQLPGLKAA